MPDPALRLIDALARCKKILLTTHVRPDGDALGTTAAMSAGLKQRGIAPTCLLLSKLPSKYAFLYDGIDYHESDGGLGGLELDDFDALLVCDTGTWSQLPGLEGPVSNWQKPKLVLDHHLTQQDWADVKLVDTTAAAAAEVAGGLLRRWGVEFDAAMATALYAGLVADTGWFQYSNTTARTLRLAADLLDAGADHEGVYLRLYQNERPARLLLQTRGMQSLQLSAGDRLATMELTKQDFADAGATVNDTEALVNQPLQIAEVRASLLFTDPPEGGPIRVSCRSKGQVDVAAFAQTFGGGGHARAAGLKIDAPLADARRRVSEAMAAALSDSPADAPPAAD